MVNQELKKTLWAAADKLRSNMDAAEYKHLVLGLIFLKYVSDTFSERQIELRRKFTDPEDEYYLPDQESLESELEDRDYYTDANVFWVPEAARWESICNNAKQPHLGKLIDDMLVAIETENPHLKNILDKRFAVAPVVCSFNPRNSSSLMAADLAASVFTGRKASFVKTYRLTGLYERR